MLREVSAGVLRHHRGLCALAQAVLLFEGYPLPLVSRKVFKKIGLYPDLICKLLIIKGLFFGSIKYSFCWVMG